MSAMYILIGFSLFVALIFLAFFFWAVRSGQYEDSYTPSVRVLFDQETTTDSSANTYDHQANSQTPEV